MFTMYDRSFDPFNHLMHYWQVMTLDIGNDTFLCKVFLVSLQGPALAWFHHLAPNSNCNFRKISKVFMAHNLCSVQQKQNIGSLQDMKIRENETLYNFMWRFDQAFSQVKTYNMDAIMQTLKQCINLRTLFFELFSKKPLETIDDLFWRGNYYAMLENDPRAVSQQLIVATHPTDSPRGISNKCSNVRIGSREKKEQGREKMTKSPLNWTPMNVTCTIAPDHFSNPRRII